MKRIQGTIVCLALVFAAVQPAVAQQPARLSGQRIEGKTFVDKAIGQCVVAMIIGVGIGTLIKKGAGTAIGGGIAAVACAMLIKVAGNKDKARIREAQLATWNDVRAQNTTWNTDDGGRATLAVTPIGQGTVMMTKTGSLECRRDDQCRVGDSWYPRSQILATAADPNAPKLLKASAAGAQELICRRNRTVVGIDNQPISDGADTACLVGDTWVTSSSFKKNKIREGDVLI